MPKPPSRQIYGLMQGARRGGAERLTRPMSAARL